ncbi:Ca(2+)/H(+) antiporter [Clostridium tepidiprofundi DSM 19306]|uniref:Ca(2+)/H(+) antiporter n=1 Tax=Clostridium tepidiprofundi DSM 19306 TaxID=1121338 RepID=A0A151B3Z8_9CLOT|nr:calcium/proton exchanger [Clostridium tepidiprofundi]KYH34641.1 Ca(2+)/H(+) antiporter [Clostridium tepidiprofundi DSM 19306]
MNTKKMFLLMILAFSSLMVNISNEWINAIIYSIAVVPLAMLLGNLTTEVSEFIGEKKGGLLAATVGNFPELVMGIWAVRYGMILMAKSAVMGCIISNMLLGLGIAVICGGVKYGQQNFNKIIARTNFNMLFLAFSSMVVMASINRYSVLLGRVKISISVKVAFVLIGVYILGLVFSLYTHRNLFIVSEGEYKEGFQFNKRVIFILICLVIVAILLYFISERLVFNLKEVAMSYDLSEQFLGVILVPTLGNVGEMVSAVMSSVKNKINLSIETSIGSSIQMALFVMPIIIIFSYFMGIKMTLFFSGFQILMTAIAVGMSYIVFQDGKTYWFEGAILISIYIMIIIGYYYII